VPSLNDVLRWLDGRGCPLWVDDPDERVDLDSADLEQIALKYKDGKLPILVECNRDDGTEGDIDDDGYDANGEFLRYFVDHCGGMIQADSEGFYEGSTIVVELER
jgi:hypothetical protein